LLDPSYVTHATQMPIGDCASRQNSAGYRMLFHESRARFPIIREQKHAPEKTEVGGPVVESLNQRCDRRRRLSIT